MSKGFFFNEDPIAPELCCDTILAPHRMRLVRDGTASQLNQLTRDATMCLGLLMRSLSCRVKCAATIFSLFSFASFAENTVFLHSNGQGMRKEVARCDTPVSVRNWPTL